MIRKLITLVLMIAAPIISGKAFYEYAQVVYMHQKPSWPFGKELMKTLEMKDVHFLSNYQNELLSIGVVFLAISVLAYLSMMIRALKNMAWLAFIIFVTYSLYHALN